MNQERYYPIYLLVLAAFVFLPGLGGRDLWAPVEPRYGEITRVMFLNNEWVVPKVNGAIYTDKPILYFWLALLFSKAAGAVNEWTIRLPAALGAIGIVFTTFKIGKEFFSTRVGLIAAAASATCARMIWEGRWAHVDALFVCFFALTMYFAGRAVIDRKRRNEFIFAYAFMALATLTKGLIGVVLPALVLVLFVLIRQDWRLIAEARLPSGIAVFLLITAPWFFLVNQATAGKWLADFIVVHHIQRYTAGMGHREPAYYYLKTLPLDFLPWTIFLVPALFSYAVTLTWFRAPLRLFFSLWFAVVFIFFSASDTKRELYLLPLFPVLALAVGNYIDDLLRGEIPQQKLFRIVVALSFFIFGVASVIALILAWFKYPAVASAAFPFACVMAGGSLSIACTALRKSAFAVSAAVCVMMALGVVTAAVSLLPFMNRFKSPRPIAKEIVRRIAPDMALYIYADSMHDFNFYTGREVLPIVASPDGWQKLRQENASGYLLVKDKDLPELEPYQGERISLDPSNPWRHWYLLPIRYRPR